MNLYTLRAFQVTASARIKRTVANVHAVSLTNAKKLARIEYGIAVERWRTQDVARSFENAEHVAF